MPKPGSDEPDVDTCVANPGTHARVHLMMDCVSNAWLQGVLLNAGWVARSAHRYADPSIHDGNVAEVIAQLRAMGSMGGLQLAAQLERVARQPGAPCQTPTQR